MHGSTTISLAGLGMYSIWKKTLIYLYAFSVVYRLSSDINALKVCKGMLVVLKENRISGLNNAKYIVT